MTALFKRQGGGTGPGRDEPGPVTEPGSSTESNPFTEPDSFPEPGPVTESNSFTE